MIRVNCSAIPASLFESELFGYEKGSFTGAQTGGKEGLVEAANGGTLFLDEINSIPLELQGKLLRVIEEKKIKRLGSIKEKAVDFRIISATNENLSEMVKKNTFRMDLFFRLNVFPVTIPPLRDRKDDVEPLANYFLGKFNQKYRHSKTLSQSAIDELIAYDWPGNVRELKNIIERLTIISDNLTHTIQNVPALLFQKASLFHKEVETPILNQSYMPGFSFGTKKKKMGIRGSATYELIFNNVKVPKENLLGEVGKGFKIAMNTLDGGRIGIAAQALGIAQGAIDETVEYVKQRMHFFNPATVMKLVEVIRGANTSDETAEAIKALAVQIGKEPVEVNEAPGFVVNKLLIPMINEAVCLVETGVASVEGIDTAMKLGANHPMGPLALGDLIGLDVCLAIMELATAVTWPIQYYLLNPHGLGYMQTIVFILVIAALVQLVEIALKKYIPSLHAALGIYLPLITTNCAVLGVAILNIDKQYDFLAAMVNSLGSGLGYFLAMVMICHHLTGNFGATAADFFGEIGGTRQYNEEVLKILGLWEYREKFLPLHGQCIL